MTNDHRKQSADNCDSSLWWINKSHSTPFMNKVLSRNHILANTSNTVFPRYALMVIIPRRIKIYTSVDTYFIYCNSVKSSLSCQHHVKCKKQKFLSSSIIFNIMYIYKNIWCMIYHSNSAILHACVCVINLSVVSSVRIVSYFYQKTIILLSVRYYGSIFKRA